jgi:hypothetical protein
MNCDAKALYMTKLEAELVGFQWRQRAYYCQYHKGWHLTSKFKYIYK